MICWENIQRVEEMVASGLGYIYVYGRSSAGLMDNEI